METGHCYPSRTCAGTGLSPFWWLRPVGRGGETGQIYNLKNKTWRTTDRLHIARSNGSMIVLADGDVLLAGGFSDPYGGGTTNDAEVYDTLNGVWTETGDMVHPQYNNKLYRLPDGNILSAGGTDIGVAPAVYMEIFDLTTNAWRDAGTITGRNNMAVARLENGKILLAGGCYQEGSNPCSYSKDVLL
ncbi:MAG: Kelch repeat-containing protein [Enterobacteriaceae bacterium]